MLARLVHVLLVGAILHLVQIGVTMLEGVVDLPTRVGIPWVFARWSDCCWPWGGGSAFYPSRLAATLGFWGALALAWIGLDLFRGSMANRESVRNRTSTNADPDDAMPS